MRLEEMAYILAALECRVQKHHILVFREVEQVLEQV
jgi:hypothetical protein